MSQYTHFFLRSKNDEFLPIGIYSANTYMSQKFSNCTLWEKLRPVNTKILYDILEEIEEDIEYYQMSIQKNNQYIDRVSSLSNCKIDEKIKYIETYENANTDYEDDIEDAKEVKDFVNWCISILQDLEYTESGINPEQYIYIGLECGTNPTVKDIF